MFKPNGIPATNIEPLILLNEWAHYIKQDSLQPPMIFAGLGKPGYLLNEDLVFAASEYWQELQNKNVKIKNYLENHSLSPTELCDEIAKHTTAIDYESPSGNPKAVKIMAEALAKWYDVPIKPNELFFTVGGLSALKMLFKVVNEIKKGRIITPLPHYPFYNNPVHHNHLHFIDLLKEPGYRLTAQALQNSILEVKNLSRSDGLDVSAFLFCDPYNPMGSAFTPQEWKNIAEVLKTTSNDVPIIIDEAYAELVFNEEHVSLLKIAPELKNRLMILRSGTKGFSASGERLAVVLCFNQVWREELLNELTLSYLHPPTSLQMIYAKAMDNFTVAKKRALSSYYEIQVNFVQDLLKTIHAEMPDKNYTIDGTFYVLANLSDLIGQKLSPLAFNALGKKGLISSDVEICYSLLFEDRIMLAPLSYFGADPSLGFVRITCCGGIEVLSDLMNRLRKRLLQARKS